MIGLGQDVGNGYAHVRQVVVGLGYISPGVGALLLQLILIAIAGGLIAIRTFWGTIKSAFGGGKRACGQPGGAGGDGSEGR